MYKIKAVLKSPLMIGGKTLNSNYRKSRDYISGSVLRAAYARAFIERCAYEQNHYWLGYKGESECKECAFQTVCKNFENISFPTLYPMDSKPYPITAREKKYKEKEEKQVLDILRSRLITQHKAEKESEWKRLEGLNKDGITVKLNYLTITRTAIDYQRNAAKEGALYTQNVISDTYLNEKDEWTQVVFCGEISLTPEEEKELDQIKILHIGADITRGLGICHMFYEKGIEEDTSEKIEERILEFNFGVKGEKQFLVLDLITDAYLGLEQIEEDSKSQIEVSDKQMQEFLEKKIGLPSDKYQLYKVLKSQEILRGFDTSKATEKEMRRQGRLVVKAGAVFVYQILIGKIDTKELLEFEKKGIGDYTEHGFGKICICDPFHMKYDVLKGEYKNG